MCIFIEYLEELARVITLYPRTYSGSTEGSSLTPVPRPVLTRLAFLLKFLGISTANRTGLLCNYLSPTGQ